MATTIRKIHYRNDFEVDVTLTVGGEPIAVPQHDFDLIFFVANGSRKYTCSRRGNEWVNCREVNDEVHCFLDNHMLRVGVLQVEFWDYAPDTDYADGSKRTVVPQALNVELVYGEGDDDTIIVAEVAADLNTLISNVEAAIYDAEQATANANAAARSAADYEAAARAAVAEVEAYITYGNRTFATKSELANAVNSLLGPEVNIQFDTFSKVGAALTNIATNRDVAEVANMVFTD